MAIIGAGFAGTMAAVQLARRGVGVVLIGRSPMAGRGVAYSTEELAHLLNIPAAKMSAWPDRPDDFVEKTGVGAEDYVPRMEFGKYLRRILDQSAVRLIEGDAIAVEQAGGDWTVTLADGSSIGAVALVLASGNQAPEPPPFAEGLPETLFAGNPWGRSGRAVIDRVVASGGDLLVVGSGLSMIDVAMSLDAAGHRGKLVAVSRRGQMPRVQPKQIGIAPSADDAPAGSLMEMWRWVRRRSGEVDWLQAVDSVRPRTHELWQSLSLADQRRFMRHARIWWDVHRHRIAPQVGTIAEAMLRDGRLEVLAGRIQSLRSAECGIDAVIRRRGASATDAPRRFVAGINCTGPLHAIRQTSDGVLRSLLGHGMAEPDHLGIGIRIDANAKVIGAQRLWAMGSLGKARYWEMISVPDIRAQAEIVADAIAKELNVDGKS